MFACEGISNATKSKYTIMESNLPFTPHIDRCYVKQTGCNKEVKNKLRGYKYSRSNLYIDS